MYTFVLILHVIVSAVLMVVVLLQSSKGGGLAGAFGGTGGAPQQILGTRGMTTLLHKITIYCGAGFFLTSFALFTLTGERVAERSESVVNRAAQRGAVPEATTSMPEPAADIFSLPDDSEGAAGTSADETTGGNSAAGGGTETSGNESPGGTAGTNEGGTSQSSEGGG